MTIILMFYIPGSSRHHWAAGLSAELCDGTVQHVDLVEEVDRYKKKKKNTNILSLN